MQAFERHFEARCSSLTSRRLLRRRGSSRAMKSATVRAASGTAASSNSRIASSCTISGSGSLAFAPFTRALASAELELETAQVQTLFNSYDRRRRQVASITETRQGPLARSSTHASSSCATHSGCSTARGSAPSICASLRSSFNVAKHPDVEAGARTAKDVRWRVRATLTTQHDDGMLSADEFETYYRNLSALIEDDASFEALIRGVWTLADKPPPRRLRRRRWRQGQARAARRRADARIDHLVEPVGVRS